MEAEVLANTLGKELGIIKVDIKPIEFELLCMGDMGGIKGFYMRTNEWWGGNRKSSGNGHHPLCTQNGLQTNVLYAGR